MSDERVPEGFEPKWHQIHLSRDALPDVRVALAEDNLRLVSIEVGMPNEPGLRRPELTVDDFLLRPDVVANQLGNYGFAMGTFWRRAGYQWPPPKAPDDEQGA
jgi:hypothetical protein